MKWWFGGLVLLALGVAFELGLLVFAMYALLGLLLISRFMAREAIEPVSVTRECTQTALEIGESATMNLSLRNRGVLPVPWMIIEESLPMDAVSQNPPRLKLKGPTLQVAQMPPCGHKDWSYEIEFLMRGYYQFGPVLLESGDLFGLHRRYRITTQPHFLLVYPKIIPLEGYNVASRRPLGEVRLTHRLFEDPTRIAGVRPFQRGDPLNRIHWHATARTGTLHSKVYEPSCVAGATILLDFHADNFLTNNPVYRAELAVTTVASLANAIYQLGQQVGFITNGRDAADRIRLEGYRQEFRTREAAKAKWSHRQRSERLRPIVVETRRGVLQLRRILETLARLEQTDGFSFSQTIAETGSRVPRDATVVAVLAEVTEETAIALGNLRRSGYAVTAVMVMFGATQYYDWAQPPEWACRLLAQGIEFRRVDDEATLARLCAEQIIGQV